MLKKRNSKSRQSRGSHHPAQGRFYAFLGSIQLAEFMRLVPFEENSRERRPVEIVEGYLRNGICCCYA